MKLTEAKVSRTPNAKPQKIQSSRYPATAPASSTIRIWVALARKIRSLFRRQKIEAAVENRTENQQKRNRSDWTSRAAGRARSGRQECGRCCKGSGVDTEGRHSPGKLNGQNNHQTDHTEGPNSMKLEGQSHGDDNHDKNQKEVPIEALSKG